MNPWVSDAATAHIHPDHGGGFASPTIDPSTMALFSQNTADPAQFQRAFSSASARHMSPGFHTPVSVVPSKRPRPDDGVSMSPRPAPGGLPHSRSQTPHQMPYPGFQPPLGASVGQYPPTAHTPTPTPYQHLQHSGSTNASPSPIPQEFDPQASQRLHTASPSPFSPAVPIGGQQSDHGSRVHTPQSGNFPPSQPFPSHMPMQFSQPPAMTSAAVPPSAFTSHHPPAPALNPAFAPQQQPPVPPQISAQQRMYQLQLQNQARQLQAANAGVIPRQPGMPMTAVPPQVATMRQMQMQHSMAKPTSPDGFIRVLQRFMASRGLPLDLNPHVSGRPVNLMQLYAMVMKFGGSKKVTTMNSWPLIAQQLQFPVVQYPLAPQEIREHYHRNLFPYEQAWLSSQQKQLGEQAPNAQIHPSDGPSIPPQGSPVRPAVNQPYATNPPMPIHAPANVTSQVQSPHVNGFAGGSPRVKPPAKQSPGQPSQPLSMISPQVPVSHYSSPAQSEKKSTPAKSHPEPQTKPSFVRQPIRDPYEPQVLPESKAHGPVIVDEISHLGDEVIRLRPDVPKFSELGVIDIHALIMSIKSGIHAEMRVALDTLVGLSAEPPVQILLSNCDDLLDALIECAEDQLEFLADNAAEVSDAIQIASYEEVVRGCRQEIETLLDIPEFGSLDYDLDRAVDRLICITTIIRNFSFFEANSVILGIPPVAKLLSQIIQHLGTRNMLLRTHQNTLDFMKDVVIYLSNLSHNIQLPGRDEAHCILHFLLAFAPSPPPTASLSEDGKGEVMFSFYNPSIHRYLPAAVDGLAKLLARDEPNRSYFKAIFAQDRVLSTPPGDLITRAFGLAVSPMPEQIRGPVTMSIAEFRKPSLMQGILAADVLSSLVDGHKAHKWLRSTDGLPTTMLRLACLLSSGERANAHAMHAHMSRFPIRSEDLHMHGFSSITNRSLVVLCRLAEKAKSVDAGSSHGERTSANGVAAIPPSVLPRKESVLGALFSQTIDPGVVRWLCEYAGFGTV